MALQGWSRPSARMGRNWPPTTSFRRRRLYRSPSGSVYCPWLLRRMRMAPLPRRSALRRRVSFLLCELPAARWIEAQTPFWSPAGLQPSLAIS